MSKMYGRGNSYCWANVPWTFGGSCKYKLFVHFGGSDLYIHFLEIKVQLVDYSYE